MPHELRNSKQLGGNGGPYVWTRLAFGRPVAAVNSVIYWISDPIWVGGSLTTVSLTALGAFFATITGSWQYVYAVVFIWFTIGVAIVSLQCGKWVPTLGAWARGVVLVFFEVWVLIYAARHGLHGFGGHAFAPSYAIFIAVVPVLFFNYAGMEVPSAVGEEMTNPRRDVPFSIAWSGLATVLAYGLPILSIVLVHPASQVSGLLARAQGTGGHGRRTGHGRAGTGRGFELNRIW